MFVSIECHLLVHNQAMGLLRRSTLYLCLCIRAGHDYGMAEGLRGARLTSTVIPRHTPDKLNRNPAMQNAIITSLRWRSCSKNNGISQLCRPWNSHRYTRRL